MTLEQAIAEIIEKNFSLNGDMFDSHTVINELLKEKEYHEAYLNAYKKGSPIENYHSDISKMIKEVPNIHSLGKIKTHNIYGNISPNELWQKK